MGRIDEDEDADGDGPAASIEAEAEAARTLEVIRRLMERGQEYESISGRGAIAAGLTALLAAGALAAGSHGDSTAVFLATWLVVALAAAAWTAIPAVVASRAGSGGTSPQARAVLRAVTPAYVAAASLTALLGARTLALDGSADYLPGAGFEVTDLLPAAWTLLHGVAILATSHHAPPRLVRLGVAFVALGVILSIAQVPVSGEALLPIGRDLAMALGFGGLHLAYGLVAMVHGRKDDA